MKSGASHDATQARFAGGPDALEQVLAGLTEAEFTLEWYRAQPQDTWAERWA